MHAAYYGVACGSTRTLYVIVEFVVGDLPIGDATVYVFGSRDDACSAIRELVLGKARVAAAAADRESCCALLRPLLLGPSDQDAIDALPTTSRYPALAAADAVMRLLHEDGLHVRML